MAAIVIWGMPSQIPQGASSTERILGRLVEELRGVVSSQLGLSVDQINAFLPTDAVQSGLGEELIFEVKGLPALVRDSPIHRRKIASAIVARLGEFALRYLPQCTKVEDVDGFGTSKIDPML